MYLQMIDTISVLNIMRLLFAYFIQSLHEHENNTGDEELWEDGHDVCVDVI